MTNLTYKDFALDELKYLSKAYGAGFRYNPMVSQAQRICECLFKHLLTIKLLNNNPVMTSHNLRAIYEFIESAGIDLSAIRSDVMLLNNFYTHTRYPGKDAFIAKPQDVEAAFSAIGNIYKHLLGLF